MTHAIDLQKVANELNDQRAALLKVANMDAGNDMARTRKWEAIGALRVIDDIANHLGLIAIKTYAVK